MPYVERDQAGKVCGIYAQFQEGITEAQSLSENDPEVLAFLNPPPSPYIIPKLLLWTRLSEDEADTVDAAISAQPARLRGIWNSATEVISDSEFFGTLQAFLTVTLGADRAAELLTPES